MLVASMGFALFVALLVAYSIAYWKAVRANNRLMEVSAELAEVGDQLKDCRAKKDNAYAEVKSLKTTIKRQNEEILAFEQAESVALAEAEEAHAQVVATYKDELRSHGDDLRTALEEIRRRDERILTGEGELQKTQMAYADAFNGKQVADQKVVKLTREACDLASLNANLEAEAVSLRAQLAESRKWADEGGRRLCTVQRTADLLRVKEAKLADAILAHRNARGHARCRLNDQALYLAYDPSLPPIEPCGGESLPELVAGCTAYWLGQLGHPDMVPGKMVVDKEEVMS